MRYLLAISVGPVQEFIAAARQTRDLWFGSQLLSEISKATAKAVADAVAYPGETLIFPSPIGKEELNPGSKLNVANVILAELTADDVKVIVSVVEQAAQARWISFAQRVFEANESVIEKEIWYSQVDDAIEFFAAWVPTTEPTYKDDRARVMRLLAGRKNGKDFKPAVGKPGVFKSSLDGLRESVLRGKKEDWPEGKQRTLRVTKGEQLDVVGLVKRTGDGNHPYPSVSRVAADPWIRGVLKSEEQQAILSKLAIACGNTKGLANINQKQFPQYIDFPFEGTATYESRHKEFREEVGMAAKDELPITTPLRNLVKKAGEPNPYLAVLVADGDRVGAAISEKDSADKHREFSKKLSLFAGQARKIVENRNHQGVLVYAGGDDVLAFVPVDKCLKCARELHDEFGRLMEKQGENITLSVGLGIGHFMENLEDLLDYGRAAEKAAKAVKGKDALALHLHKRGGAPIAVQASWKDSLDTHLTKMAKLINEKKLSGRVAYDLRRMADLYEDWPKDTATTAIQRDAMRMLSAKKPEGGDKGIKEIEDLIKGRVGDVAALKIFAQELLIARLLAAVQRQADGKKGESL